ncbi:2-amino-4-hydroxy-6-hydroxymethyldihydropteridine diphosphokinase [Marispirochaeta sp.]|uniref:2-amino-4-hydroxy-6- hydroxymethyldihydropteridine diphosphokinase n=1 Tax=Marispirochaeta sp. TaxID=2038653 RepID=UPI00374845B8
MIDIKEYGGEVWVYLGLGSNSGDSEVTIRQAALETGSFLREMVLSSIYRTLPRDDENQPLFQNAVCTGLTRKSPLELLMLVQAIEKKHGRRRDPHRPKGPRTLDIDILLYGNEIISRENLVVPHPRMTERKFALVPMLELDPLLKEPGTGIFYAEYARSLEAQGIYYISLNHYSTTLSWEDRAEGYGSKYGNKRKQ